MTAEEKLEALREYIAKEAELADRSSHEWDKAHPGCDQVHYRAGMWFMANEIRNFIGP